MLKIVKTISVISFLLILLGCNSDKTTIREQVNIHLKGDLSPYRSGILIFYNKDKYKHQMTLLIRENQIISIPEGDNEYSLKLIGKNKGVFHSIDSRLKNKVINFEL